MKVVISIIGFVIIFCWLTFYIAEQVEISRCRNKSSAFEDFRFSFLTECMVKYKGKWIPLDSIKWVKIDE